MPYQGKRCLFSSFCDVRGLYSCYLLIPRPLIRFSKILTDQIPFHEVKRDITVVFRASRGIRPTKPASAALPLLELNDGIWQIMQQCWVDDPDKRLTIHQVLERLREVWSLNLTNMRLWKTMVKEKEVCTTPLSAQSFRNAMRGWELVFSKNELDTLKKYSR